MAVMHELAKVGYRVAEIQWPVFGYEFVSLWGYSRPKPVHLQLAVDQASGSLSLRTVAPMFCQPPCATHALVAQRALRFAIDWCAAADRALARVHPW